MTTPADITALVAMLRQIQCEPASFDTYSMASAAERAADAIERLQLSAIDDQEICRRGDEIILELDRKLAAAQSSLTASEKQAARMSWIESHAVRLASPHMNGAHEYHVTMAFHKLRGPSFAAAIDAAMEKANG